MVDVSPDKVINRLLNTIKEQHLRIAVLEAQLQTLQEQGSEKEAEKNGERSSGEHNETTKG